MTNIHVSESIKSTCQRHTREFTPHKHDPSLGLRQLTYANALLVELQAHGSATIKQLLSGDNKQKIIDAILFGAYCERIQQKLSKSQANNRTYAKSANFFLEHIQAAAPGLDDSYMQTIAQALRDQHTKQPHSTLIDSNATLYTLALHVIKITHLADSVRSHENINIKSIAKHMSALLNNHDVDSALSRRLSANQLQLAMLANYESGNAIRDQKSKVKTTAANVLAVARRTKTNKQLRKIRGYNNTLQHLEQQQAIAYTTLTPAGKQIADQSELAEREKTYATSNVQVEALVTSSQRSAFTAQQPQLPRQPLVLVRTPTDIQELARLLKAIRAMGDVDPHTILRLMSPEQLHQLCDLLQPKTPSAAIEDDAVSAVRDRQNSTSLTVALRNQIVRRQNLVITFLHQLHQLAGIVLSNSNDSLTPFNALARRLDLDTTGQDQKQLATAFINLVQRAIHRSGQQAFIDLITGTLARHPEFAHDLLHVVNSCMSLLEHPNNNPGLLRLFIRLQQSATQALELLLQDTPPTLVAILENSNPSIHPKLQPACTSAINTRNRTEAVMPTPPILATHKKCIEPKRRQLRAHHSDKRNTTTPSRHTAPHKTSPKQQQQSRQALKDRKKNLSQLRVALKQLNAVLYVLQQPRFTPNASNTTEVEKKLHQAKSQIAKIERLLARLPITDREANATRFDELKARYSSLRRSQISFNVRLTQQQQQQPIRIATQQTHPQTAAFSHANTTAPAQDLAQTVTPPPPPLPQRQTEHTSDTRQRAPTNADLSKSTNDRIARYTELVSSAIRMLVNNNSAISDKYCFRLYNRIFQLRQKSTHHSINADVLYVKSQLLMVLLHCRQAAKNPKQHVHFLYEAEKHHKAFISFLNKHYNRRILVEAIRPDYKLAYVALKHCKQQVTRRHQPALAHRTNQHTQTLQRSGSQTRNNRQVDTTEEKSQAIKKANLAIGHSLEKYKDIMRAYKLLFNTRTGRTHNRMRLAITKDRTLLTETSDSKIETIEKIARQALAHIIKAIKHAPKPLHMSYNFAFATAVEAVANVAHFAEFCHTVRKNVYENYASQKFVPHEPGLQNFFKNLKHIEHNKSVLYKNLKIRSVDHLHYFAKGKTEQSKAIKKCKYGNKAKILDKTYNQEPIYKDHPHILAKRCRKIAKRVRKLTKRREYNPLRRSDHNSILDTRHELHAAYSVINMPFTDSTHHLIVTGTYVDEKIGMCNEILRTCNAQSDRSIDTLLGTAYAQISLADLSCLKHGYCDVNNNINGQQQPRHDDMLNAKSIYRLFNRKPVATHTQPQQDQRSRPCMRS